MKPGTFRLRLEIHKVPMKGRPIANMSHSWLAPAGLFLCQHLLPLQQKLQFAVSSSFQFFQRMPVVVDKDYEIATIDIQNLYPSIDTEDLISSITALLHDFYSDKPLFAQVLCNLLTLVLRNQLVLHRGEFFCHVWDCDWTLTRRFPCDALDKKVADTHVDHLAFYARLVDDSLVCSSNIDGILNTLNSWKPGIDWIISSRGGRSHIGEDEVPFLDVQLSHSDGRMAWRTYRKPLNSYLYLPRASAHPKNVFAALIAGETHRLWRSNQSRANLMRELGFFVEKLAKRGYVRHMSWNVIRDTLRKCERHRACSSTRKSSRKHVYQVATYSTSFNKGVLKRAFQKYSAVLNAAFGYRLPLGVAYKVQPNQFRRHFADNWH